MYKRQTPICFGLDPEDNTKLTDDPETAKPIVLDEAGVYYEIDIKMCIRDSILCDGYIHGDTRILHADEPSRQSV